MGLEFWNICFSIPVANLFSASTGEASSTDNGASESEDAKHILDKLGWYWLNAATCETYLMMLISIIMNS